MLLHGMDPGPLVSIWAHLPSITLHPMLVRHFSSSTHPEPPQKELLDVGWICQELSLLSAVTPPTPLSSHGHSCLSVRIGSKYLLLCSDHFLGPWTSHLNLISSNCSRTPFGIDHFRPTLLCSSAQSTQYQLPSNPSLPYCLASASAHVASIRTYGVQFTHYAT
ncbi:hypothetical protein BDP81DRAFT_323 [Colletotrichum phormii]|uniref:Uncharacterized protein n=1 Tax=Colletotrichum phormii TaxID=359342 RepID=A0AAJ0A2E6_9PEZI|nr:uncharacterized protein BDP81DRAFT_323 [Colletotrichum phormii]KAK1655176.1 hypothetical protein BDP81DRAFT_323 [Colletotrichum phormii]